MSETLKPIGPNPRNRWHANGEHADLTREAPTPRPVTIAAEPKAVRLDLMCSACIVIDMQNDFLHEDGWLAGIGVDVRPARACIEPLTRLLPALRSAGVPVIWVNWGNRPDLANISPALMHVYDGNAEGKGLGAPLGPRQAPVLTKGSWSASIVDELLPEATDLQVEKYRMSGL